MAKNSPMSMKKIAELAGVSSATVSYVINGRDKVSPQTRERVLKIIEENHYQPSNIAKSLRKKSTKTIGIVVEDIRGFSVPEVINGISEYAEENGYQILLYDLRILEKIYNQYAHIVDYKDKINKAISFLTESAMVDTVIFVAMFDRDITGIIEDNRRPVVFAYCTSEDENRHCVSYDNFQGGYMAMLQLLEAGHRKIGIIGGLEGSSPCQQRLEGVQKAFMEYHLSFDSSYVQFGKWDYLSGIDISKNLLDSHPDITALFCMNDIMAAGAYQTIYQQGKKIPQGISLMGFDDRDVASFLYPPLSTIKINLKEIGLVAAEIALENLHNPNMNYQKNIIANHLMKRHSIQTIN